MITMSSYRMTLTYLCVIITTVSKFRENVLIFLNEIIFISVRINIILISLSVCNALLLKIFKNYFDKMKLFDLSIDATILALII